MDKILFIPHDKSGIDIHQMKFPVLDGNKKSFIDHFLCCVHLLQEVQQHFCIYKINLDFLRETFVIAEYNYSIAKIYCRLFSMIRDDIITLKSKLNEMIKDSPELVIASDNFLNGSIAFINSDGIIEAIYPDDYTIRMFEEYAESAESFRKNEENGLIEFKKSMKLEPVFKLE